MYSYPVLLKRITEAFASTPFIHDPMELYEPIAYSLDEGGKRLRPVLVLLACDLFGGDIEKAIYPAMGLEIFHNFTLLHDDIMDQAAIRRGKESVHTKWNANTAILSGDTMFVLAYEYVAKTDPALLPKVMDLFNDTAKKVCEGQQYDMNYESRNGITIGDYMMMIRLKTAVLIACSLKLGAILSGAAPMEAERIYEFGIHIGLAFQLQDDYLDAFGNTLKFGKAIGGDIVSNKKTFLYIKAFELATDEILVSLTNGFTNPQLTGSKKIDLILAIYRQLNVDKITNHEIEIHLQSALEVLEKVRVDEPRKKELRNLTLGMMQRES